MPGVAKAHHGGEVGGGFAPIRSNTTRPGALGRGAGEAEGKVLEHARQELRVCVCV